jgi:DNA-directed RNA polymerase subunit K/omega
MDKDDIEPELSDVENDSVVDSDNEEESIVIETKNEDFEEDPDQDQESDGEIEDDDLNEDEEGVFDDIEDDLNGDEESLQIENNVMSMDNLSDDEDDLDEDYLQKVDKQMHESIIKEHHPELITHNNEEIQTSCKIIRDRNGNITDPLHRTLPYVTCYEKARVLGERARQINQGAQPFIEVDETMMDGYLIALKEFEQRKIPFVIQRPLPNGCSEYWKLSDLEMI